MTKNTKLRQPVSLSLTEEESELLAVLNAKGIKTVMVMRRGLSEYQKELDTNK